MSKPKATKRPPRIKTDTAFVKGKKVEDLLQLDFNTLTPGQQKAVLKRAVDAANKRAKAMEKAGYTGLKVMQSYMNVGKFTTAGKNTQQELAKEYARTRQYLTTQSGSIKEYRKIRKNTLKTLHEKGITATEDSYDRFFAAWETLKDMNPNIEAGRFKYTYMQEVSIRIADGMTLEDTIQDMQNQLSAIYERQARLERMFD